MVSQSDPAKVLSYWISHDYLDVATFLIASLDNLRSRGAILKNDLTKLDNGLKKLLQKISENPSSADPNNKEISQMFKDLHYLELEVIQRISILIELLAANYRVIRTNLRDLPRAIGSKDIRSKDLHEEFNYFEMQTLDDVWRNFRYPNIASFKELTSEEKATLKEILNDSANTTLEFFREVCRFNRNFRILYNKYKHSLAECTGIFGVDKEKHLIESNVLVRDKVKERATKTSTYYTYLVPLSPDTIQYFDKIAHLTWTLIQVLLDNILLSLVNEEKDFVPRTVFVEKELNKEKLRQITAKIVSYTILNVEGMIKMNPPNEEDKKRIEEIVKRDHIYRMKRDLLDFENLKKTVTLEKNE